MMFACALLFLVFAAVPVVAGPKLDLKYEIITSHDEFLAALHCKADHYAYFKRIGGDKWICIRDIDTVIMDNGGAQLVDLYIKQRIAAMRRKVRGDR